MIEQVVRADRIYNTREIAEMLSVDEQTVRRWLRNKELAGVALGTKSGWRVTGADLIAFWHARSAGTGNEGGA